MFQLMRDFFRDIVQIFCVRSKNLYSFFPEWFFEKIPFHREPRAQQSNLFQSLPAGLFTRRLDNTDDRNRRFCFQHIKHNVRCIPRQGNNVTPSGYEVLNAIENVGSGLIL